MESALNFIERNITKLFGIGLLIILFLMHQYSFLLFHTMVELVTISIAWAVFILTFNSRDLTNDSSVVFIGIAYLFVSILDLLHTLSYAGLNIFHDYNSNLPTQLWISARYLNSISFLIMPLISMRRINYGLISIIFAGVTGILLASIFAWHIFPDCYIEGSGLTGFKIVSEYIICIILAAAVVLLRTKSNIDRGLINLITLSLLFLIVSELFFTLYLQVSDFINSTGHMLKTISSILLYKALIETGIRKPFSLLFKNLKENETNLLNLNTRLEMELQKRHEAELKLRTAVKDLERSNKDLEQFAYVASHDLQEPLRMISGFTKLLESKYKDKLDERGHEYIWFIVDGSKRMSELISDLLSYSRVTTKAAPFTKVDLNKVLSYILTDLKFSVMESEVSIKIDPLPELKAEATQIKQLFQNLIQNAIKFRNDKNPYVKVSAVKNGNEWTFSIKDNGIGIKKEYYDKIFMLFQRLHEKDKYPGTGIGLAICKKIVEHHGGKIWVESEEGNGTTFFFTLPSSAS